MASVTAKLDRIMERLETLSLIENRLDIMASTMANMESTLSRLDADVTMLKVHLTPKYFFRLNKSLHMF